MIKLIKLTDDKFNGNHPKNIQKGFQVEGELMNGKPTVGESLWIDHDPSSDKAFATSMITEIIHDNDIECKFKTLNSTYLLTYEGGNN
jgi:hypothetical protein